MHGSPSGSPTAPDCIPFDEVRGQGVWVTDPGGERNSNVLEGNVTGMRGGRRSAIVCVVSRRESGRIFPLWFPPYAMGVRQLTSGNLDQARGLSPDGEGSR